MSKTLFEDVLDDFFLRSIKKRSEPIDKKATLGNYFYIGSSKNKNSFFQYFFELRGSIIVLKKKEGGPTIAYMDVHNTFIRLTQGNQINGETFYGIKFFKKNVYEEVYTNDENILQTWYEALKSCCILTKFRIYFKTVKKLGAGNFAQVFLVERISDKKLFAVKVFSKKEIMKDQLEIKCLRYEIEMMRQIKHNRVLGLFELYEGENNIYCLCEYYEGQNLLEAIVKKGAQPEMKSLSIILQLLIALDYLHSKSIIHRDLKPENIIFKQQKGVIDIGLVDLGFATFEEDYDKLFKRCGTPGYVAPEVLNDLPYNCKADIYSCGIIFYILFFKKIDWKSTILRNIIQRNCYQKYERRNRFFKTLKREYFQRQQFKKLLIFQRECLKQILVKDQMQNKHLVINALKLPYQKVLQFLNHFLMAKNLYSNKI